MLLNVLESGLNQIVVARLERAHIVALLVQNLRSRHHASARDAVAINDLIFGELPEQSVKALVPYPLFQHR